MPPLFFIQKNCHFWNDISKGWWVTHWLLYILIDSWTQVSKQSNHSHLLCPKLYTLQPATRFFCIWAWMDRCGISGVNVAVPQLKMVSFWKNLNLLDHALAFASHCTSHLFFFFHPQPQQLTSMVFQDSPTLVRASGFPVWKLRVYNNKVEAAEITIHTVEHIMSCRCTKHSINITYKNKVPIIFLTWLEKTQMMDMAKTKTEKTDFLCQHWEHMQPSLSSSLSLFFPSVPLLSSGSWLQGCRCCCDAAFWGCVPATCLRMEKCLCALVHCILLAFCFCQGRNSSETFI